MIASVSQPFCRGCTRARLTIEGKLVTCLFAAGGVDLRTPLRAGASDDELRERIAARLVARAPTAIPRSAPRSPTTTGHVAPRAKIEMYQVGG